MVNYLDYKGIEFPVFKSDFRKVEKKYILALMCFAIKITWFILFINQMKHLKTMDLLIIANKNKSHYAYIKGFNRYSCNKSKNKNKKHFCKYCLQ